MRKELILSNYLDRIIHRLKRLWHCQIKLGIWNFRVKHNLIPDDELHPFFLGVNAKALLMMTPEERKAHSLGIIRARNKAHVKNLEKNYQIRINT